MTTSSQGARTMTSKRLGSFLGLFNKKKPRGKHRMQDHLATVKAENVKLRQQIAKLQEDKATDDRVIHELILQNEELGQQAANLSFQLQTAIRANRMNELAQNVPPMIRDTSGVDDQATVPIPRPRVETAESATLSGVQVVQEVHPIPPESANEVTQPNGYVITTVIPATFHGEEFGNPVHVLGRVRR